MRRSLASSRPRSRTETFWLGRCAMDTRRSSRLRISLLLLLCGLMFAGCPPPGRADEVTDWNVLALDVLALAGHNNIVMTRGLAMAHLATHDALNAIDRRYKPYLFDRRAEAGAAADAAVAAARRDGIAVGQAAAAAMLTLRKSDGATALVAYTPGTQPGQWRPHPNPVPANPPIADSAMAPGNLPAMLPQWGQLMPFTMRAPWQFRLPPPPSLTSELYTRDYNEVKRLGGKQSAARTADQAEMARYWFEGSPQGWNRIGRIIAAKRGLDRWEHARLLALLNAVLADSYIAGADTRYLYNFWRPVTAIRAGDSDGNDATVGDSAWETFVNTPPLPDYPSTHGVCGGAAATVMARFFGTDQMSFTMTSGPPFAGITRSFKNFSEAQEENGASRVYSGIHFRTSAVAGITQGEQIGRQAFAQYLQPYRP